MAQAFVRCFRKQRHPPIYEVFFIFGVDGQRAVGDIGNTGDIGKRDTEVAVMRTQSIGSGGTVKLNDQKDTSRQRYSASRGVLEKTRLAENV